MNRTMLMFAILAAVAAVGACDKKDFNAPTGTTNYTSVSLSSDPTSFAVHVQLVPRKIDTTISVDSTMHPPVTDTVIDTIPAHDVPVDSIEFNPIATLEPQGVAVANGTQNMTFVFRHAIAEINGSQYLQGDTTGTDSVTITYTDVNHGFATTTLVLPVTVTQVPPPPPPPPSLVPPPPRKGRSF